MLPIATLPAAGLLLRFGQADMLGRVEEDGTVTGLAAHLGTWLDPVSQVFSAAGGAVFDNLPIIFAVGVAIGMARRSDGSTAIAGLFGYLVFAGVLKVMAQWTGASAAEGDPKTINYGVLGGILIGLIAAKSWERHYRQKLPDVLAFFGGRRFVPMVVSVYATCLALVMGFLYPAFNWLINEKLGGFLMAEGNNVFGGFVFGTINRLLVPFGLHHLLNSIPWFQLGSCTSSQDASLTLHGDLTCFLNGTPETSQWTGSYMTGFFPIMMFGLVGAALAMAHTAFPERKNATTALMVSVAATAFLTGITEPLEYSFAYVAFPLYAVHAVLTGLSLAIINLIGAKMGFNFSAGFTDFAINATKSADYSGGWLRGPVAIVLVGLAFFVVYYFLFRFLIVKFGFATPGRETEEGADAFAAAQQTAAARTGKEAAVASGSAGRAAPDTGRTSAAGVGGAPDAQPDVAPGGRHAGSRSAQDTAPSAGDPQVVDDQDDDMPPLIDQD
ncbi:MAG: PTS transporter subunit EIIC [Actinomyces sp.]|nr:PTS transporter subunit EIIC [Actinomyces sp.]